jgi:heat-inducible transcriptional repressor
MQAEPLLTGRARDILHSIVKIYIETGEPVGSRTLAEHRRDRLSAASIRNVMAELAEEGYLSQPHTSAGRIPTEKAFRHYVGSVMSGRLPVIETGHLRTRLLAAESVERRFEVSSQLLSELTLNVGIAAAMPASAQVLDQVELLALADRRVLMILVTQDRMVRDRVVFMQDPINQDELNSIRNYVNRNFGGWELWRARRELLRRIEVERAVYDDILRNLSFFYEKGLLDDGAPAVHMEGASNLVGLDLRLTREKMRDLLRALEEKQRLLELLDRFLEEPPGELGVRLGLGEAHPAMGELALIGVSCSLPSGLLAKVAVLGPMRMHYERVMSAVLQMGRMLASAQ